MEQVQLSLPQGNMTGPNCGITALAVAAGVHFRDAFRVVADNRTSFPKGSKKRWNCGTRDSERRLALKTMGVEFTEVSDKFYKHSKTLENWVMFSGGRDPEKMYMVTTTKHVQIVKGKTVLDQNGITHYSKYWGRRKRITGILEIKS